MKERSTWSSYQRDSSPSQKVWFCLPVLLLLWPQSESPASSGHERFWFCRDYPIVISIIYKKNNFTGKPCSRPSIISKEPCNRTPGRQSSGDRTRPEPCEKLWKSAIRKPFSLKCTLIPTAAIPAVSASICVRWGYLSKKMVLSTRGTATSAATVSSATTSARIKPSVRDGFLRHEPFQDTFHAFFAKKPVKTNKNMVEREPGETGISFFQKRIGLASWNNVLCTEQPEREWRNVSLCTLFFSNGFLLQWKTTGLGSAGILSLLLTQETRHAEFRC